MKHKIDQRDNNPNLQQSAQRVQEFLDQSGLTLTVIELPRATRTAPEAAESVGCTVSQIAKSIVFKDKTNRKPILVIAAGSNRVDTRKIEKAAHIKIGRADGNYVKEQVGYAIGGVPPAGHQQQLQTFLDPDLRKHTEIWAAAGTPHALFKLSPHDLERLTNGTWLDLSEDC